MSTITKYAGTITQSSGGAYRSFSNLAYMKNNDLNSNSTSSGWILAKGSNPNRPATLSFTKFNLNVPQGAEITKIIVEYRHGKTVKTTDKYPSIGAPTITLLGVDGLSGKGKAPTKTMTYYKKEFKSSKLTRNVVNSNSFGVKLDYPANTNSNQGKVSICYVRLYVVYTPSQYTVSMKKVAGGYNEEDYTVQASISNKNLTSYNPSVTITSPIGFSFVSNKGDGTITQVNSRTFTWNPKLTKKIGTANVELTFYPSVTYSGSTDTYTGTFEISENLNNAHSSHTATITERPVTPEEEASTESEPFFEDEETFEDTVQTVTRNEKFKFRMHLTDEEIENIRQICEQDYGITDPDEQYFVLSGTNFKIIESDGTEDTLTQQGIAIYLSDFADNEIILELKSTLVGFRSILAMTPEFQVGQRTTLRTWNINTIPIESSLENPLFTLLELTPEECDRLGHNINYIVESFFKLPTIKTYVEKWYKNYRLGVFNNAIYDNITVTTSTDEDGNIVETVVDSTDYDNLTPTEIFENADYWGECLQEPNTWENVECEFTYNKNYPLYIIVTSMYKEQNSQEDIQFINLCIVEESQYDGREETGIYPYPINSLISGDGDYSELTIDGLTRIPGIVFHQWPLSDDYGNDENFAVRGIALTGSIEKSDDIILYAKLRSPTGLVGERSIVIDDDTEDFTIGGIGDLWGLSTLSFKNLEDWEIELDISNLYDTNESTLIFGHIQVILYVEQIEPQSVTIKINGENIAYYGAFIEDIEIPEGLKTDTDFITVDGTDTNDAYRQNIREKEITIKFSIDNCDLELATMMLKQITNLLVNKKDKYNRPIPKTIEFSHYPGVYWEYIMESTLDVDNEYGSYEVKAKLTVPSGTSSNVKDTVTNNVGYVQGLASVNPVIVVSPGSEDIEILETLSNQKFNIKYPNTEWNGKLVEIDCINRQVLLKTDESDYEPVDISQYADKDVDWFSLYGEYRFSTINCALRTVTFNERW